MLDGHLFLRRTLAGKCLCLWINNPLSVSVATPEDVILHKLVWYRKGGETSERQWGDIVGVLNQQYNRLDMAYLSEWADRLQIHELWNRVQT